MAPEWLSTTLGGVVRLQRGHDLPDRERVMGSVPVMGSFGITGWHNRARANGPGVTVGRSGASIGVVSFVEVDYWPLNTCLYVTDFQGNDPRFCYYWLSTLPLAGYNSGSAQPSLNRNLIYGLPVHVPGLDEQRAIANVLGTLDDKIGLNQRMNETLESIARTIFKSWFVDFDPVRARAEGGLRSASDSTFAEVFPDRLMHTNLGEVPERWKEGLVGDLVSLGREGINPLDTPDEFFDHYSIPAFDDGARPVRQRGEEIRSNKFLIRDGCVLLSRLNPRIPRVWLPVPRNGVSSVCSTEFAVALPLPPFTTEFVYGLFSSFEFQEALAMLVTGTSSSHQRVKPPDLLRMPVVVPERSVVQAFTDLTRPLLARIRGNIAESATLASMRDTLLPKLISGEIQIKNAERFVEAAL